VYGGPHARESTRARAGNYGGGWLAEHGFVVVSIDGRAPGGEAGGGSARCYRRLGAVPLEDQAKTLRELGREHDYLDLDRVGIFGWSFGGYLSALAVMLEPDLFKAAIAGAPVTDWADTIRTIPNAIWANRRTSRMPTCVKTRSLGPRLRRPLLLIHGTADDNVYFSHSLKLADALLRAGRRFELVPLANQTHRIHDVELFGAMGAHRGFLSQAPDVDGRVKARRRRGLRRLCWRFWTTGRSPDGQIRADEITARR
jgi:dipeptidyl-peptidase-4